MKFEVPQRHILHAYIIRSHGPKGFCNGRGKRGALVVKAAKSHGREKLL